MSNIDSHLTELKVAALNIKIEALRTPLTPDELRTVKIERDNLSLILDKTKDALSA